MLAIIYFGVSITNMKVNTALRRYTQTARALSAEATAQHIVDAFLDRLMKQWYDEITLDLVAEDAGVTVQTVVRRFGGKEGLLASGVKTLGVQINARRALEPRHPALREVLDFGRSEHRRWVASGFAGELGTMDTATRQQ